MEKKFYLNVFLYNTLTVPVMQALRKMATLRAINSPDDPADNVHSDNRIFSGIQRIQLHRYFIRYLIH